MAFRSSLYLCMNITQLKIALKPFEQKSYAKALGQLGLAMGLAILLFGVNTYIYYNHSLWWWLLTTPLLSGLMVRIFIFFHDSAHHNLTSSRTVNVIVGHIIGFITLVP